MLLDACPTLVNNRSDQVFNAIIGTMVRQPAAVEVDTGLDTYPFALDNVIDEQTTPLQALQSLAMSELGYIYVKGDLSQGGTLAFESRSRRPKAGSAVDSFDDASILGLSAKRGRDYGVNKSSVTVHPRRVDSGPVVLFTLNSVPNIGPNASIAILAPFRDPNSGQFVRIGAVNQIDPVAVTDFMMNAAADGSSTDLTAQCTVVPDFSGNSATLLVTNTSGQTGYLTKLQVRGDGLYDSQTAVLQAQDDTSIAQFGLNVATIDMPYQSDVAVGSDAASYIVHLYKNPLTQIQNVELVALIVDDATYTRLIRREISDKITIQESVTGLTTSTSYFINGIDYDIDEKGHLWCTWTLAPSDSTTYWILEQVGASELDATTLLGYGLIVGHGDAPHSDVHTDSAHQDVAHGYIAHSDTAHGDATHGDSAHTDTAHTDTHTDVAHGDTAHGDVTHVDGPHADSHNDVAHTDIHTDTAHSDVAHADTAHSDQHDDTAHDDVAHGDVAHGDVAHADAHSDFSESGFHKDTHHDVDHGDVSHEDVAHADDHQDNGGHMDVAHGDLSHADTHTDGQHSDDHQDTAHSDTTHTDVAHADSAHADIAHVDSAHTDVAHVDGHVDTAHSDAAHSDTAPHVDVAHGDSHTDVAHSDS